MPNKPAVALDPMPDPAELRAASAAGLSLLAWRAAGRPVITTPKGRTKGALRPWHPYRSKWEADYARHLATHKAAHVIRDWSYEPDRLEIGLGAFYTPDFRIYGERTDNGYREYHEVKGYRREAAMVRIKAAAKQYPAFKFVLVSKINGAWQHTTIGTKP